MYFVYIDITHKNRKKTQHRRRNICTVVYNLTGDAPATILYLTK